MSTITETQLEFDFEQEKQLEFDFTNGGAELQRVTDLFLKLATYRGIANKNGEFIADEELVLFPEKE